jgi:DNA processing protein
MMAPYRALVSSCAILSAGDAAYPACLGRLPAGERPARLFVAGAIPPSPGMAIVGTRAPDAHGLLLAGRLARECASRGIPVVSGGASGIDSEAHRSCLDAGGTTVVVLAGGLEHPHPPGSEDLFVRAAAAGGCFLSDQQPAVPTRPFLFLRRNRLIAALARCVIVVQAGGRSGALSTAAWARRCAVPLFAAAGSPLNPRHLGTNRLIGSGKACIIAAVDDFFREIDGFREPAAQPPPTGADPCAGEPVDGLGRGIMALLGTEPVSVDVMAARLHAEPSSVLEALFDLEMRGLARASDPGRFVASVPADGKKRGKGPPRSP